MKRTLISIALMSACVLAGAQHRQQSRKNPSMLTFPTVSERTEIILPEVNGYKVIKADLHVHTCYSDGHLTPAYRVTEAWQDGLDVIAITDHIEYRPNEKKMEKFLADGISVKEKEKGTVSSDLNFTVSEATAKAAQMGITIIPGTEITRDAKSVGHYNALFTTDNNLIPDHDPLQAIRNAKKQGALVQSNHPGWRCPDNNFTKVAKAALKEGLIDGVEVFNSSEFYPDVIETAVKTGLYISCGSDIHAVSHVDFGKYGVFRDMTLILAKDASAASVREALENRRTITYAYGDIAGSEELLKDFFLSCIDAKLVYTDSKGKSSVQLTNKSSLPFVLALPDTAVDVTLNGLSSIICKIKDNVLTVTVSNMWYGPDKHITVDLPLSN